MSHTLELLSEVPHGTVEGYRAGCHGSGISCGAVVSCATVYTRYQGDWSFRKRIDAGEDPASIFAAELAEQEAVRARDKLANRKAKAEGERADKERARRRAPQLLVTNEVREAVARLALEGKTLEETSSLLGLSKTTVSRARRAAGVRIGQRKVPRADFRALYDEGLNDAQIARRLGISTWGAANIRRELQLPRLGPDVRVDRTEVARLHGEGLHDSVIAARVGASARSIARVRKELGLPMNREGHS